MEQDKSQDKKARRVKNVNATGHRSGTLRGAVKPQQRTSETGPEQLVTTYMSSVRAGSLKQTIWGANVTKYASTLRKNFGLASNDTPFLLCDLTGTCKAGVVLSTTGIHIADGRGGTAAIPWKDLPKTNVSAQSGMLVIGSVRIVTSDAATLAALLQHVKKNIGG